MFEIKKMHILPEMVDWLMKPGMISSFIFFLLTGQLYAGWILEQTVDGSETETVFIQDQKIKFDNLSSITIMDIDANRMVLANPDKKIYFSGRPSDLSPDRSRSMDQLLQQQTDSLSTKDKAAVSAYLESLKSEIQEKEPKRQQTVFHVEIKQSSSGQKIAGYPVDRYTVWVNGSEAETLWISSQFNPTEDLDPEKWLRFLNEMSDIGSQNYYQSPEYQKLLRTGFPLKSIDSHGYITEVKKVTKKDIESQLFQVPGGYRQVPFDVFMSEEMNP